MTSVQLTLPTITSSEIGVPAWRTVTVTATAADLYDQCPRRYWETQGQNKEAGTRSPAMQRGILVHDAVEMLIRDWLTCGTPPEVDDIVLAATRRAYGWRDDDEVATALAFTRDALVGARDFIVANGYTPVASEQWIRLRPRPILDMPNIRLVLSGRIDVVLCHPAGHYIALDIKTGSSLPRSAELAACPSTLIYSLLILGNYADAAQLGVEVARLLPHRGSVVSVMLSQVEEEAARRKVRRMAAAITEGAFLATAGSHCDYCRFVDGCPATRVRATTHATF